MNAMGEAVWDQFNEDASEQGLPPGFRFHPTDEELVTYYLASKVVNGGLCGLDIVEVDLNRCEPWELPDMAKMGEKEWYFYSLRDRKYPTGLRTNRATGSGYWKATGKDREVLAAATGALVGMKKTLVFYKGRAPRGEKTKWVLHEYRLDGDFSRKDEWVICRILHRCESDKKNSCYSNHPTYFLDPSSSSTPIPYFPRLIEFQTLENPIQTLLQDTHTSIHEGENHLLPLPLPQPSQPTSKLRSLLKPQSTPDETLLSKQCNSLAHQSGLLHEGTISSWLESYLQNPLVYDMAAVNPLGLPLAGVPSDDILLMGPAATIESGPLFP